MLRKVILCPNPYRDKDLAVARRAKAILDGVGCPNAVCLPFREKEKMSEFNMEIKPLQQELHDADVLIAFGGDGTLLHLSKTLARAKVPMLGVNLGGLGFLADLEAEELEKLADLAEEKFRVEERMMLDVEVHRGERVIFTDLALNEAVIARGVLSRVIRLHLATEDGTLFDTRGDGVIVSSPTGSTAYCMSAGGPIVEPTTQSVIVSTICAHTLHANAYVLSADHTVTVQTEIGGYKPVILSVDGGKAFTLHSGDAITVRRSECCTKLVRMKKWCFSEVLYQKMVGGV